MRNTMEIEGYRAIIQFDPDIEMFRAELRATPFDLSPLRDFVRRNSEDLTAGVLRVFRQGWPDTDADVTHPASLRAHVVAFADSLEAVVARLCRRLRWAMEQTGLTAGRTRPQVNGGLRRRSHPHLAHLR